VALLRKDELDDKPKSDSFIKAIATFQIIWATIQVIVRTVRKIAVSQLELAVIAFATCAVVIYLFYWSKPKCVSTVTTILQYKDQIPKDVLQLIQDDDMTFRQVLSANINSKRRNGSPVKNDTVGADGNNNDYNDKHEILGTLAMAFGATLFGGIHIGAWNFEFPSQIELIFWRCASAFSAAFGPAILLLIPYF